MTHSTPEVFLVWSVLSCLLFIFVVYHLWSFDRFHCLRWNWGNDGGFKRFMTYNYILGMPCWVAYSVGFCAIKYSEGYVFLPEVGVIPKPYQLWSQSHRKAVLPLYLCLSVAWGTEMVTHLESLCFVIFLLNAGSGDQAWFRSWCFKAWVVGSFLSLVYLPLITIFTRSDPLKSEIYIYLSGSVWSLLSSICSIVIMSRFKPFLDALKRQRVDISVIVRLTKFRELNIIYICSRTLSTIPLLLHGSDGLLHHHHINVSPFVIDLLQMVGGIGFAITGAIALPIFFPRSIEGEIMRSDGLQSKTYSTHNHLTLISRERDVQDMYEPDLQVDMSSILTSSYISSVFVPPSPPPAQRGDRRSTLKFSFTPHRLEPNRRQPDRDADSLSQPNAGISSPSTDFLSTHDSSSRRLSHLSRFFHTFKSPIDVVDRPGPSRK